MKKLYLASFAICMAMIFTGCSDSSESTTETTPRILKEGVFLDDVVINAQYETSSGLTGFTDGNGMFQYYDGDTITFNIGNIILGRSGVPSDGVITPRNLAQNSSALSHTLSSDAVSIVIMQLLQTLDDDNNPSNGIQLKQEGMDRTKVVIDMSVKVYLNEGSLILELKEVEQDMDFDKDNDGFFDVDKLAAELHYTNTIHNVYPTTPSQTTPTDTPPTTPTVITPPVIIPPITTPPVVTPPITTPPVIIPPPTTITKLDSDGDGLNDAIETAGWEVYADRVGLGQRVNLIPYMAYSNPDVNDTDGDGLSDYEEYFHKTDPLLADTDFDSLTDYEEINRWKTSPTTVDSDQDSRGVNKTKLPNSALFDGAELRIDFLGDPTHTPGFGATSPLHADTDGDGWSDYDEIVEKLGYGFNPTLADIPKLDIEIASSPIIRLTGATEDGSSWSKDVAVSDTLSQSVSKESSSTRATEQVIESSTEYGTEIGVSNSVEVGADSSGGFEAKWTGTVSAAFSSSQSLSSSMANSQSISWSESQSKTAEQTYEESIGLGSSKVTTIDGGYVSLPVNLVNKGDVTFTMTNLRVNVLARYLDGTSNYTPAVELQREGNTPLTLAPGQKVSNVILISTNSDDGIMQDLLKNPSGLLFEVSSYDIIDAGGVSYGFAEQEIKQKTVAIYIDFNDERSAERYLVSTIPNRISSIKSGVKLETIMTNVLGIPYETRSEPISGFHSLSSVRDIFNDDTVYKKWVMTTTANMADQSTVNSVSDIVLQAGDSVYLTYIKDVDGDGISRREEFLNGTLDTKQDTDEDGINDFEEIRNGSSVRIEGEQVYTAFSKGFSADSDGDDINDTIERSCGLDSTRADTDLDGISDFDELYGYDIHGTQNYRINPYAGVVIVSGMNGVIDSSLNGDDIQVNEFIQAGPNGIIDSTPNGDDYLGVEHIPLNCSVVKFASNPLNPDTDLDRAYDGIERDLGIGSPNNPFDGGNYIDSDNDGLSDQTEISGWFSTVNDLIRVFTSNPNESDSDNDGISDYDEKRLGSNPKNTDTDGDGLSDADELNYATQLTHNDSDRDGLHDNIEITGWDIVIDDVASTPVTSDPNSAVDRDGDGLTDSEEYALRTSPSNRDTDGDNTNDNAEAALGKHPLYKDSKITIKVWDVFTGLSCDDGDPAHYNKNEWRYEYYVRRSDAATDAYITEYFEPTNKNNHIGVREASIYSFVSRHGETFTLYGALREWDSGNIAPDGVSRDYRWDGGLAFYDSTTGEALIQNLDDEFGDHNPDHITKVGQNLKFTVGSVTNTELLISGEGRCQYTDNGSNIHGLLTDSNPIDLSIDIRFTVQ